MSREEFRDIVCGIKAYISNEEELGELGWWHDAELDAAWQSHMTTIQEARAAEVYKMLNADRDHLKGVKPQYNQSSGDGSDEVKLWRSVGVIARAKPVNVVDSDPRDRRDPQDQSTSDRRYSQGQPNPQNNPSHGERRDQYPDQMRQAPPQGQPMPGYQQRGAAPHAAQAEPRREEPSVGYGQGRHQASDNHISPAGLTPPPSYVRPQPIKVHSDRSENLQRARLAHSTLLSYGPFGWENGRWHQPQEPAGGFSLDERLELIRTYVSECHRCRLCEQRRNVVTDDGSPSAKVMFIGEGPGEQEDAQGLPFVGKSGELLTKMIGAMGLDRQRDVYIANIVKCRPPANRDPYPDEISRCLPFLLRQIDAVKPKVIVLLGKVALSSLFPGDTQSIVRARGFWLTLSTPGGLSIPTMPTYHPSYVLRLEQRGNQVKGVVWKDLQQVMLALGEREGEK